MVRNGTNTKKACLEIIKDRDYKPHVKYYYGPTGSGKCKQARQDLQGPFVWHPTFENWWADYFAQDNINMEEFIWRKIALIRNVRHTRSVSIYRRSEEWFLYSNCTRPQVSA